MTNPVGLCGPQIGTHSGRKFSLLATMEEGGKLEEIDIHDIAWALSQINRFTGHGDWPYSVGQHSILVSALLPKRYALAGLLHDATEAYLGDVSSPLKSLLPGYKKLEQEAWRRIAAKFGISEDMPGAIHRADRQALALERRVLVPRDKSRWNILEGHGAPRREDIISLVVPADPRSVCAQFILKYEELSQSTLTKFKTA